MIDAFTVVRPGLDSTWSTVWSKTPLGSNRLLKQQDWRAPLFFRPNFVSALNASSSPAVTKQIQRTLALTAGAATVNLASLVGTNGAAVDFTGLKVQHFKFINPGANPITFTFGASNPYLLLGSGWKIIVPAHSEVAGMLSDQPPDVDSTHKNIDIAGTGTDSFNIILVAG